MEQLDAPAKPLAGLDDDIEIDDEACPHCGAATTLSAPCAAMGCEDGFVDMHAYDDPLWYDEGETEACGECFGTGRLHWCKSCGFDFQDPRNRKIVQAARKTIGPETD